MIRIDQLIKRFGTRAVLDGLTLQIARSEVTAICGPSGCGKSTLLRCIIGLEGFDSGTIEVGEHGLRPGDSREAASAIRLTVGMVFQQYALFPHMTALENVMEAPVHVRGVARAEALDRASALLDRVGLSHRRDAFPRELSGGEQQRVAIARALAMTPRALLLDEPTSALDPDRKAEVVRVLEALAEDGTTMVIVTHEPALAQRLAKRAVVLREGRVVADGPPASVT